MFEDSTAFGSFSTDDVDAAAEFYGGTLGLTIAVTDDAGMGRMLWIRLPGGGLAFVYPKEDHVPATHTVLNFGVPDFEATLGELRAAGIEFERLEWTDDDGVARDPEGGIPTSAWFKDPAGNWIMVADAVEDDSIPL